MAATLNDLQAVIGQWYSVTFDAHTRWMRLTARKGKFYALLPIVSAVDSLDQRDIHKHLSNISMRTRGATKVLTFTETSSLWDRKEYTIQFGPKTIKYSYKVFGRGQVGRAYFFRSWFSDDRTVETEMGVSPGYNQVFSPAANFMGKHYYFAGDQAVNSCGDDFTYWGQGLVSAPYYYAFNDHGDKFWMWAGLGLKAGQYTFETFNYNTNVTKRIYGPGGMDCNYNGKLEVNGSWQSPTMILGAADDEWQGMQQYVGMLEKDYGLEGRRHKDASWWKTPIFCGWGEQMSLAYMDHGNFDGVWGAPYCIQALHDEWLEILRRHDIKPGQIIIDAGWEQDGTTGDMVPHPQRWPDLRGWIDARREEGIRTVLWMCAWNRSGVPDDECITDAGGKCVNVDPTNPRYQQRLRAMVRRMVSSEEGCYNCDGLKIDGELMCPIGPGLKNHANLWGLELQGLYMEIIHDELKKHKKDGMMGLFMANPYLARSCDVARTADMFSIKGDPTDEMFTRAKILSISQFGRPIDTDHSFCYDVRTNWIDIMSQQARCGIPCMYHIRYVMHKHPFMRPYIEEMTGDHYKAVSKVFKAYWRSLKY